MAKTIMDNLRALGFKNAQERTKDLEEHKSEIVAYFKEHGTRKTVHNLHVGRGALRRWGLIQSKQKPPKAKVKKSTRMLELEGIRPEIEAYLKEHTADETCQKFHVDYRTLKKLGLRRERVRGGIISSIVTAPLEIEKIIETLPPDTDVGYLIAKGLINKIEALEKTLTTANAKITKLESQLAEGEKEKERIVEHFNKALAKAKGIHKSITLTDLRQIMGLGPDGTRQSFRE